jgi:hypothetical protein
MRRFAAPLFLLVVLLTTAAAFGLVKAGDELPSVRLEDADGRGTELTSMKGKPILVVYEDKGSADQNKALKDQLAELARGDKYKTAIALAAVADLADYDFWPVKGFVKDAIREESKKQKTTIYCDWTGSVRKALGVRRGRSNVVLFGKDGKALFAASGALDQAQREQLITLLKSQVP